MDEFTRREFREKNCYSCAKWNGPFSATLIRIRNKRVPRARTFVVVRTTEETPTIYGRCSELHAQNRDDETPPDAGFACETWEQVLGERTSPTEELLFDTIA